MALAVTGAAGADDFHGARLTFTGSQTATYPNHTPVEFTGSEELDTDAYHDTGTNPSRITIPTGLGGIYLWLGELCFSAQSSNDRIVRLRADGSTVIATASSHPGGQIACYAVHAIRSHVAGDYVQITGWQSNGSVTISSAALQGILLNPADAGGGGGALDDLSDVTVVSPIDGAVLKYDEETSQWRVATDDAGGEGSSGPVTLSAGDRERLDLNWWGVWALVGLVLVLMISPALMSVMRVTRGMADGRG